jgi:hypothetical protein
MDLVFLGVGIVVGVFGLLLLFAPKTLVHINEVFNRTVTTDPSVVKGSKFTGFALIIVGVYLFYRALQFGIFK